MPSKWYYEKGGVRKGPVTSEDIRRMVANGTLLPTDLLWKEGMKDWMPAGKSTKLFSAPLPGIAPSIRQIPEPPGPNPAANSRTSTSESAHQALKSVAGSLRDAGSLVQKQAYRTKLIQIDLPRALAELGEVIYSQRLHPQVLAREHELVSSLLQQMVDLSQPHASSPSAGTLGERAKRFMVDANTLARRKVLELQITRAKAQVAESALKEQLDLPGCRKQLEEVSRLRATLSDTDKLIETLSNSKEHSTFMAPGRLVAAGAAICVVLVAWVAISGLRQAAAPNVAARSAVPPVEVIPTPSDRNSGDRRADRPVEVVPAFSDHNDEAPPAPPVAKPEIVRAFYATGELLSETPQVGDEVHGLKKTYFRNGKVRREIAYEQSCARRVTLYRPDGSVYLDVDLHKSTPAESLIAQTMRHVDLSKGPNGDPVKMSSKSFDGPAPSGGTWRFQHYDFDSEPWGHGPSEWSNINGRRMRDDAYLDPALASLGHMVKFEGGGRLNYVAGYPHGMLELTYLDGSTMLTMYFVAGVVHGPITVYYPVTANGQGPFRAGQRGKKRVEATYMGDQLDGQFQCWYANGRNEFAAKRVMGKLQGKATHWYEDGQVKIEETYANNKTNGPFTWWWPNGQIKAKGAYLNGELDGRYTAWDDAGAVKEESVYVNGSPQASQAFAGLVERKKREGFVMVATANPRGDSRYKFAGCQVGYRSSGDQDEVIAVVALKPLPKDMVGDGATGGAGLMITNYGQVMGLKGMFVAVLTDAASRVFGERLTYMELPGGQRIIKDTTNGRTSFTGILVVEDEVCTFEIPPENRRVLDNEHAFVRCGGQVITLGLSNGPEMDPRKWSAARKVLSGGRSN